MKMISSTSITSMKGVTLISCASSGASSRSDAVLIAIAAPQCTARSGVAAVRGTARSRSRDTSCCTAADRSPSRPRRPASTRLKWL
ncbi:hypothetical protein G6F35_018795 [Rhizopus arrhizus]|nr:hypothetical protein G6F35_018795 [Rhizopus arrhizus]